MAIYKNIKNFEDSLSDFTFPMIDLKEDVTTEETVEFNKEDYLKVLNEAKEKGYAEGVEKGYSDSYLKGLEDLKLEREKLYSEIEDEKNKANEFLESQGVEYVNTFKKDINNFIYSALNKIFLDCVEEELFMKMYLCELLNFIDTSFKNSTIYMSQNTKDFISEENFKDLNLKCEIDNSLHIYDIVINSKGEFKEYFLNDQLKKMREMLF